MKFLDQIRGITLQVQRKPENIFGEIIGHEEPKEAFNIFLQGEGIIAVLMQGPPACSKSLFIQAMRRKYKDSFWINGGNASGAGMLDAVFDRKNTSHLLIDEVDGLKAPDQKAILDLIETGVLSSVKVKKNGGARYREFSNLKIFVTCNNVEKLSKAFQSRFFRIYFKEYTEEEFIEIAIKMFPKKDPELCEYIAKATWRVLESKNIRDCIRIIKSSKNSEAADKLISLQIRYGPPKEESEE